jgi:hypothetical protein
MYLVTYSNISGGYTYGQYNDVRNKDYYACILDTWRMTEDKFDKEQLYCIIKAKPNIQIEGIKHSNGKITDLYIDKRVTSLIEGDYALVARYFTMRGNYCNCYLYKKNVGLVYKWQTPHYTHYDWNFALKVNGNRISVIERIEHPRFDISFVAEFKDNNDTILVQYMPCQAEVDKY